MTRQYLVSAESVCEGHPDKIADQISDAVVDSFLRQDPDAQVACETMITQGLVVVAGEIVSDANVDVRDVVRHTIKDIGYTRPEYGFDYRTCAVTSCVSQMASDPCCILGGKMRSCPRCDGLGASDQVIVFGHAADETPEYMPLPVVLAHKLCQRLAQVRIDGVVPYLRPDGKAQVTVEYSHDVPRRVACIVLNAQHNPGVEHSVIERDLTSYVIREAIPADLLDNEAELLVNSAGHFVIGGPVTDTGLTGRKLMVDTYGGACPHGGGALSGKDPGKIDRSAAYMARYIAKNIVAAGLARRCTAQIAYATGRAQPVALMIDLHSTGTVDEQKLEQVVPKVLNLTPRGIIDNLNLRRPIYRQTAVYGHFGRGLPDFTWEKTDMTAILQHYAGVKGGTDNDNRCQSACSDLHSR